MNRKPADQPPRRSEPPHDPIRRWSGPEPVVLALGANLGNRMNTLERACVALRQKGIRVVRASRVLRTRPLEGSEGPVFLNVCLLVRTALEPHPLLRCCQGIERELGRRRWRRWEARTLDIDLIFYGRRNIRSPTLTLPHPAWRNRDFVLRGLMDLGVTLGPGGPGESARQFHHWLRDAEPCILSPYSRPLRGAV